MLFKRYNKSFERDIYCFNFLSNSVLISFLINIGIEKLVCQSCFFDLTKMQIGAYRSCTYQFVSNVLSSLPVSSKGRVSLHLNI